MKENMKNKITIYAENEDDALSKIGNTGKLMPPFKVVRNGKKNEFGLYCFEIMRNDGVKSK